MDTLVFLQKKVKKSVIMSIIGWFIYQWRYSEVTENSQRDKINRKIQRQQRNSLHTLKVNICRSAKTGLCLMLCLPSLLGAAGTLYIENVTLANLIL